MSSFDVEALRAHFPSLRSGAAHFDGPGGSQTPDVVAQAVATTMTSSIANRGRVTPAERRADDVVTGARSAMADYLGADPRGVVFGRSMTALTMDLARTLSRDWAAGDEVVVSRLDHDANIRPWSSPRSAPAPRCAGSTSTPRPRARSRRRRRRPRRAHPGRRGHGGVEPHRHDAGRRGPSPGWPTTPARSASPTPSTTRRTTGSTGPPSGDVVLCSPYKFFGPHLGVLAADPAWLETLHPDKLLPSSDAVPERFELGTLPYELLAGTTAAVDLVAGAVPGEGTRAERLDRSVAATTAYEDALREVSRRARRAAGVTLRSRARHRTPTLLLQVHDLEPRAATRRSPSAASTHRPGRSTPSRPRATSGSGRRRRAHRARPYTSQDDVDRSSTGCGRHCAAPPEGGRGPRGAENPWRRADAGPYGRGHAHRAPRPHRRRGLPPGVRRRRRRQRARPAVGVARDPRRGARGLAARRAGIRQEIVVALARATTGCPPGRPRGWPRSG